MKYILLILLSASFILNSCKSKKEAAATENQTTTEQEESNPQIQPDPKKIIIDDSFSLDEKPGSYTIENIEFEGRLMKIAVSYSGGCEDQTFDLYGSKAYAKSMPPQTTLQLHHDSKGDPCRQLIKETLVFDIEEIQHPSSKTLIIRLKGHTKSYEYTY